MSKLQATATLVETDPAVNEQLLIAAAEGDVETIKKNKNAHSSHWAAALYEASANGHPECVSAILDGANLKRADIDYALATSSPRGHASCVPLLIKSQCSRTACNLALKRAAENGHVDYVKSILPFSEKNDDDFAAAEASARYGHDNCLALLLPDEPALSLAAGDIVLLEACIGGHPKCVNLVLDINWCSPEGMIEALCIAIGSGLGEATKRLLSIPRVKEQCKTTDAPIWEAIAASDTATLRALLPLSKNCISNRDVNKMLCSAAANESPDCLNFLLRETKMPPTLEHIQYAVGSFSSACAQVLIPMVDLNDTKHCSPNNVVRHPLVQACSLREGDLIALLAPHVSNRDVTNVALLNGMQMGPSAFREKFTSMLQKTTLKSLSFAFAKAKAAPVKYIFGFSGMSDDERIDVLLSKKDFCSFGEV